VFLREIRGSGTLGRAFTGSIPGEGGRKDKNGQGFSRPYRIAIVKSADQVALEAGDSPAVIFRHYRELTTEETVRKWFGIGLAIRPAVI